MFEMRTVLVSSLLTSLTVALVFATVWQSLRRRYRGVTHWLAAAVLQVSGLALVLLRGQVPAFLSVIAGNLCLVVGFSLLCHGLALFTGAPSPARWLWALWGSYAGLLLYATYLQPSLALRIACTSAALAWLAASSAAVLLLRAGSQLTTLKRATGSVLLAIALLHSGRALAALALPSPADWPGANPLEALLLLFNQALAVGLGFSVIFLANGRLLQETQENEHLLASQAELLRQREGQIQQYADTLEERVALRTRQLAEAQEQLLYQEKLAVIGKLANVVGHELRNPLGNIQNAVYLLKLIQPQAEPRVKEYLELIKNETRAADGTITDLLEFARVKTCDPAALEVGDVLRRALERQPIPQGVSVSQTLPPDLPRLRADQRHIVQALGNLVLNACQAMPQGGSLSLRARRAGSAAEGLVAIEVADTGTGIQPEHLPRLFEPLFTTRAKGVGLGLAVAQKLVQANGGKIEVHSEPGKGSLFTIYLPADQEKPTSEATP
jgi:signal transduction histidine kinase